MPFSRILLLCVCLSASIALFGQNSTDALRFSTFDVTGTSRFIATGSSLGALGTEFSVLSTNPAGLGAFRSSQLVLTPSFQFSSTKSKLEGAFWPEDPSTLLDNFDNPEVKESKATFTISNLGFVVASQPRRGPFTTFNFGIGVNNLANYNQNFAYNGYSVGSIAERWQEFANEFGVDSNDRTYEESLALAVDAIFYDEQEDFYFTDYDATLDADFIGAPLYRQQTVDVSGSNSELVFSLGTNYQEKVMFGLTIGVPIINYRVDRNYIEEDMDDDVPLFLDLAFEESIRTTGQGINAKLGIIYRASQALRLGVAVHTPTSLTMNDESSFGIGYSYNFNNQNNSAFEESDRTSFSYKLSTPWRFFGSAGFLFGKSGFLSAEVEYVDYSSNSFNFGNFTTDEEIANDEISRSLKPVLNVRLGGEFVYEIFRARAGVGLMPSALEGSGEMNPTFSGGLGVQLGPFSADLAYRHRTQSSGFVPYGTYFAPQQFVSNEATFQNVFLTLAFRY